MRGSRASEGFGKPLYLFSGLCRLYHWNSAGAMATRAETSAQLWRRWQLWPASYPARLYRGSHQKCSLITLTIILAALARLLWPAHCFAPPHPRHYGPLSTHGDTHAALGYKVIREISEFLNRSPWLRSWNTVFCGVRRVGCNAVFGLSIRKVFQLFHGKGSIEDMDFDLKL